MSRNDLISKTHSHKINQEELIRVREEGSSAALGKGCHLSLIITDVLLSLSLTNFFSPERLPLILLVNDSICISL